SQGMTVAEMAGFLQSNFGVYNALNLDGGGSTTMSWVNPSTGLSSDINVSSNSGGDRYVGASLAVFASPTPEPGTMTLLFAAAGGGIACVASRRRKTRQAREVIQDIRSQPMGSVKK
ncbi:MAG: phosphodiester glycosidase family protein, partial [Isosphaeraceae bacterium]